MNIYEIFKMTESEAKRRAEDSTVIKGYNVYFVYLDQYFRYSCLVFKNSRHIYHVNEYELHWSAIAKNGREYLKQRYIERLNNKLFTDEEIKAPLSGYADYRARADYLRNCYGMQFDNLSIFCSVDDREAHERAKKEYKYFNQVAFTYMKDKDAVDRHTALFDALEKRKEEMSGDYGFYKDAFLAEMADHEYIYNCQADFDTLSVFGNLEPSNNAGSSAEEIEHYLYQLSFNKTQKKAYYDARTEMLNAA